MRTTGNFPSMHVCSGDTLGSTIVVRGAFHALNQNKEYHIRKSRYKNYFGEEF